MLRLRAIVSHLKFSNSCVLERKLTCIKYNTGTFPQVLLSSVPKENNLSIRASHERKMNEYKENLSKLHQITQTNTKCAVEPKAREKKFKYQSKNDVFNFFKANYKFLKIPPIDKDMLECSSYFSQLEGGKIMDNLSESLQLLESDTNSTLTAWKMIATARLCVMKSFWVRRELE